MRFLQRKLQEQQGVTALFVALAITLFFGAAAMAIDLGMLATARAEAQNAADAAALAAASAFIYGTSVDPDARRLAADFGRRNAVRGQAARLVPSDVQISGDTVRIAVRRDGSRGSAVSTIFGRVLGTRQVDVSARAAAAPRTGPARIVCALPIALPDRWVNRRTHGYSTREGDRYIPYTQGGSSPNRAYSGYGTAGERIVLTLPRATSGGGRGNGRGVGQGRGNGRGVGQGRGNGRGGGNGRRAPSTVEERQSLAWLPAGFHRPRDVEDRIRGCPDGVGVSYAAGDWLGWFQTNPFSTRARARRAFRSIVSAPGHRGEYYHARCRCIRDRNDGNRLVIDSPRYRALPLFDPDTFNGASNRNLEVIGFVGIFVESIAGSRVTVRILPTAGTGTATRHPGPLVKRVALVE